MEFDTLYGQDVPGDWCHTIYRHGKPCMVTFVDGKKMARGFSFTRNCEKMYVLPKIGSPNQAPAFWTVNR